MNLEKNQCRSAHKPWRLYPTSSFHGRSRKTLRQLLLLMLRKVEKDPLVAMLVVLTVTETETVGPSTTRVLRSTTTRTTARIVLPRPPALTATTTLRRCREEESRVVEATDRTLGTLLMREMMDATLAMPVLRQTEAERTGIPRMLAQRELGVLLVVLRQIRAAMQLDGGIEASGGEIRRDQARAPQAAANVLATIGQAAIVRVEETALAVIVRVGIVLQVVVLVSVQAVREDLEVRSSSGVDRWESDTCAMHSGNQKLTLTHNTATRSVRLGLFLTSSRVVFCLLFFTTTWTLDKIEASAAKPIVLTLLSSSSR